MKRVAIIGTVGVPGRYGGFETLAHQLVNHLSKQFKLIVYCSAKAYKKEERVKEFNGARLFYVPLNANGVQSILYDFISIIHALFVADTLIILGVSGGILVPFVRLFTNKKIIVNIDGLEWRRAKWHSFAKGFLKFSERVAVRWSHADITDNAAIKRYTSKHYNTLSHLIEYGGDHVIRVNITDEDAKEYPFIRREYAFKVARIEPENNIHMVLTAFENVRYTLVVVGNWANSEYGVQLKRKYKNHASILLLDPIYNQEKLDLLRANAHLYVHGHSAGGTNPSLVEAMNLSLPIIAFNCSYNRASTENKAIFFKTAQELSITVKGLQPETIFNLGEVMKEIAERRYTWKVISKKYSNLINSFDYQYKKQSIWSKVSKSEHKKLVHAGIAHLEHAIPYHKQQG